MWFDFLNDRTRLTTQIIPAIKKEIIAVCKKIENITIILYLRVNNYFSRLFVGAELPIDFNNKGRYLMQVIEVKETLTKITNYVE